MPLSAFTNSGSSSGGAVPYQRVVEPSQLGFYLNLEQAELVRIQRYSEAWRFYFGRHWAFGREDGEPLVTLNYFRKFVDKHAEFLVSKGFTITTPESLEETSKAYLDEVWNYNNREQLAWDIATMGGVTGDVFALITDEEPTEMQKRIFPFSQGKTRINLLGSEQVFPTWDPLNTDTLVSVRIETLYYANRAQGQNDRGQDGKQLHTKRFTQIITPERIMEQHHGEVPVIRANRLGEIALVHMKNLSVPREYYGMGDGQDLIDLNRELNEKSTDISDVVNYHAAPITVITGAKAKNLERGARQIWSGLPADAQVFNLKLEGDLTAAQAYWDKIKSTMHELGDVPEGVLGQMQPISNTSGVALHVQYQPIIGRAKRKRANYEPGFAKINYFILRIGMVTGRINLPFDLCKHCGGRILQVNVPGETVPVWDEAAQDYIDTPRTMKKCYVIDKQTLEFQDPNEMRVKIWREYGFGGEIREVSLAEAREIVGGEQSFWDYAYRNEEDMQAYEEELERVRKENHKRLAEAAVAPQPEPTVGEDGQPVPQQAPQAAVLPEPPPPIPKVKRLPMGEVNVPEEPEKVTIVTPLLHPATGREIRRTTKERMLVPTDCRRPEFLNPFENTVTFSDVLPKDEAIQADLYERYQRNAWVDEEWVQARIPEIAGDIQAIKRRLKAKATSGQPQPMGAALFPGAPAAPVVTDMTPAPQPMNSVPGPGGNPVPPEQG